MKRLPAVLVALALSGCLLAPKPTPPHDTYAIVASQAIMDDAAWRKATVEALQAKYPDARVAVWQKTPDEVRPALAAWQPSFTAFVVRPEEAGLALTVQVSHLCRALDDDPYTDTFWGIITGYDPSSAEALATAQPIAIERALDCSGCDLTAFKQAWRYTEDHRGTMNVWQRGTTEAVQDLPCDTDNTQGVLERLQKDRIQFLSTSGHATQHDWQMGYSGPNMALVHHAGKLIAVDTQRRGYSAHNPEPKVYFANGNCLIGDVDKTDCMALSWMRDGGVRQMMGYTVTTWFGAQGWGTLGLFVDTAGLCTANEAFHFTNAGIVKTLEAAAIPDLRNYRLLKPQQLNLPKTAGMQTWAMEQLKAGTPQAEIQKSLHALSGNLHDRDTVCFYGDPALDARIAEGRWHVAPPRLTIEDGRPTLSLTAEPQAGVREGTVWFRLPGSWHFTGLEADPALGEPDLVLDNMIRFPKATPVAGQPVVVRLRCAKRKGS